ncbi:PREDICTED: insulin-like growth factor-binding protein 2 [Gekko japonicus]|uniref:Insulin-like growth factor-binding protein 2 n=1 Tax=Gekko japonicus TaxID=146911 RepID=A0ABM1JKU4_GEKJA|nr:PREDICTED: insulin-like growth factor-binding protein 2 [Gekko japonicus]
MVAAGEGGEREEAGPTDTEAGRGDRLEPDGQRLTASMRGCCRREAEGKERGGSTQLIWEEDDCDIAAAALLNPAVRPSGPGSRKAAASREFVIEQQVDLVCVTETWVIHEPTPHLKGNRKTTSPTEKNSKHDEHTEASLAENHVDNTASVVPGSGGRKVKSDKELAVARERVNEQQKQMGKPTKHHHHPELRPSTLRTPCQQQLDQVLERISTMRLPDERGPLEHLYSLNIPNCDKQGLYNLKQCKMSVNGQRGECWCVNPNTGKKIQGAPTIRGDPECHLFYAGHEQEDRGAHVN